LNDKKPANLQAFCLYVGRISGAAAPSDKSATYFGIFNSIIKFNVGFVHIFKNLIQGFVALATTAKEGLPLPPLWTHPAPPEHHA